MIKVVYHRQYHRVTVKGHAYSGEAGHDLVCSAASVLTYTLAANMSNFVRLEHARQQVMDLYSGNAEVSFVPQRQYRNAATLMMDAICVGYELLARDYPDFISYEIRG